MNRTPSALFHRATLLVAIFTSIAPTVRAQVPGGASGNSSTYANMAPLSTYLEKKGEDEIALALSAAPSSISDSADILVFSANGYHRVRSGTNGWTCLVQRSWTDAYDNPEFWNPRIRVPICFNSAATQSVLPVYLERTKWVVANHSLPEIVAESKLHSVPDPIPGSFAMMLSKRGYLADGVGAAAPHVMFFMANVAQSALGATLPGSPVGATPGDKPSITIFYLPSRTWSDGTPFVPSGSTAH